MCLEKYLIPNQSFYSERPAMILVSYIETFISY